MYEVPCCFVLDRPFFLLMETWTGNNFTWWSPAPPHPTSSKWSPRSRSSSWISLPVADVSCQRGVHCQWQREGQNVGRCLMILIVRVFSMRVSRDFFFFKYLYQYQHYDTWTGISDLNINFTWLNNLCIIKSNTWYAIN